MTKKNPPRPEHVKGTRKGEELVSDEGPEPGRRDPDARGYRTARDSTGVNPKDEGPIDPRMPHMPPA